MAGPSLKRDLLSPRVAIREIDLSPVLEAAISTRISPRHFLEASSAKPIFLAATKQLLTGIILWLRDPINPNFPSRSVVEVMRDRQPRASPTLSTSTEISIFAMRANCSVITSAFNCSCRATLTCWKSQPPQPLRCENSHGATTRSDDASITSITSARLKELPTEVISIRHRSPGIAWRTKITAPSCRAMKWPPWATFSIATSITSPTTRVLFIVDATEVTLWV